MFILQYAYVTTYLCTVIRPPQNDILRFFFLDVMTDVNFLGVVISFLLSGLLSGKKPWDDFKGALLT